MREKKEKKQPKPSLPPQAETRYFHRNSPEVEDSARTGRLTSKILSKPSLSIEDSANSGENTDLNTGNSARTGGFSNINLWFKALIYLLSLIIFSTPWMAQAQTCLPDGITFTSQAQIDAFASDYPGCKQILGYVLIEEDVPGDIINLQGLSQLTAFGDDLAIRDNRTLSDLSGLDSIRRIGGSLSIFANPSLVHLMGLEALTSIGYSLMISSNHKLTNLKALGSLASIGGGLDISFNTILRSVKGLEGIDSIGGYLLLEGNPVLASLKGLDGVTFVEKSLIVKDNEALLSLNGLDALTTIAGHIVVDNNRVLASLQGLDSLRRVGAFLQITNNEALLNLRGLNSLQSINGLLQIYRNPSLVSLFGIDSIDHSTIKDVAILMSFNLSECGVQSICDYLSLPTNSAAIEGNSFGCNTREQITKNCPKEEKEGEENEPEQNGTIVFFPNPTSGQVEIKGAKVENANLKVMDSLGRLVLKGMVEGNTFDLSNLTAGLYFVELVTDELSIIEPICKAE